MASKRLYLAFAAVVAVLVVAPYITATTIQYQQALAVAESPIFAMPDTSVVSIGDTATTAIADRSPASESAFQRLIITNTSTSANACVYWVAAAASCGSSYDCNLSGTNDGILILPSSSWSTTVAGDLRTCVVSTSASSTVVHVARAEVP